VGTSLAYYATTNARGSAMSKSKGVAYSLAEAGVADALARLANDPANTFLFWGAPTTRQLADGSYTYTAEHNAGVWTITSTGRMANPTGNPTAELTRTVTRKVDVLGPTETGSFSPEWNRLFHTSTSSCFNVAINLAVSVATGGDLCLTGGGSITGASTRVSVGDDVTLEESWSSPQRPPATASGWTSSTNIFSSNDADASTSLGGGVTSANLDATNFGFSIPSNATITGIEVRVERGASTSSAIRDNNVQLLKAGAPVGSNKAVTGSTWGSGDSTRTYGNSGDLWATTWTPAEVNASTFGLRFQARNSSGSSATAYVDFIDIEVHYYTVPTAIGSAGTPVEQVDVAGWCQAGPATAHAPCGPADNVWGSTITTSNTVGSKPESNFTYWFWYAKLGPKSGCNETVGSPPSFDSNGSWSWWPDGSNGAQELTPETRDYQCRRKDAQGNVLAELSWNRATRVLTVKGTIFFDGNAEFHDHITTPVHYQGRATIWISENWHNDEAVCAGGSGTTNCRSNMSSWDPSQNLLLIMAGGTEGSGNDDWQMHQTYSAFQGMLWANNDCNFSDSAYVSGPVICDRIQISDSPQFFTWPALPGATSGQLHPNGTTRDMQLVLGSQTG
jgi:hypothetical protein